MLLRLFIQLGLFAFLILFVSADKVVKKLYYFNDLKSYETLKLSHAPGVYEDSLMLTITVPDENARIELIENNQFRRVSGEVKLTKPSVLKISYRDAEGKLRNFVGNYIVNAGHELPIVALVVDTNDFFPPNGIYVGHLEVSPEDSSLLTIGRAWHKRPIQAFGQFFLNGQLVEELELDLKTYGGMTLGWKEKSLQLSARKKLHGEGKINAKIFRHLPFREYQHVVLRTSGNDQNKTRIKDMSISMVADELNVNTKDSRPTVVYMNGVYWGIHNMREKVNSDYFKYRYAWKKGDFVELQGSGFYNKRYKSLINYVRTSSNDTDFYQRISDSIDVENFFNFNIIQTYISNTDYRGNIRFFKHNNGKWRWVLYDTDLACNHSFLNRNFIRDRTFPVPGTEYWYNPSYATALLHNMLKNDDFKQRFIKQYTYLMATKLTPKNFIAKIDLNIATIESELERHLERRNRLYGETRKRWEGKVMLLKSYLKKRPESALKHLGDVFQLGATKPLKVTQNISHFEALTMNGSKILVNSIDGRFFDDYGVDIEAVESNHLYHFTGWSDGIKERKRTLQLKESGNKYIANFEHIELSLNQQHLKLRRYYVNNDDQSPLLFVSILNTSPYIDTLHGVTLYEDRTGSNKDLSKLILEPGEEMMLTNNCELLREKVKDKGLQVINFMEGMNFVNDVMFALIDKNGWIDSLHYEISDSLLIEHPGFLIQKDSSGVKIENMKLKKMKKLTFGIAITEQPIEKTTKNLTWLWLSLGTMFTALFVYFWRKRKISNTLPMLLLCGLASYGWAQSTSDSTEIKRISADQFGIGSIEKRFIDNKGRGDERFYGTRNFRVVLYDLVYRGGGNNLHLKDTIPKYYLWNPMPIYGLRQLQSIGFDKAVYLYSYNFEYWYPQSRLDSLAEEGFDYICEPKLDRYLKDYLQDVMDRANDKSKGMMYIHCWNGWHQSGLLSAYTLMQFCGYSNYKALKYWEKCTDGNYRGFSKVKARIKNYKPYKEFSFTEEQQKRYCPCETDVSKTVTKQSDDDKINLSADEMMQKQNNSSSSKNYVYHTIRAGESLGIIAERYGMGVSELKRLNGIRGTTIYAGRKLKVLNRKPSKSNSKKYKVKSGDSLYSIARKHNTSIDAIKKTNGLKNDTIYPGQTLKIP